MPTFQGVSPVLDYFDDSVKPRTIRQFLEPLLAGTFDRLLCDGGHWAEHRLPQDSGCLALSLDENTPCWRQ